MTGGDRVCRWWVARYTRSCPVGIADERRAEIESDLWEHAHDARRRDASRAAHDVDVLRRVLSGVPADLSWRREVLRSHPRSSSRGATDMSRIRRIASTATVVLAAIAAAPALSLVPLLGTGVNGELSSAETLWIAGAMTLGAVLLCGLVLRAQSPSSRLATTLLVLGAPAPALAWFWLPPSYLLSAIVIVLALATHRREVGPVAI